MIATLSYTFVYVSQLPTIAGVDGTNVDTVLPVLVLVFTGKELGQSHQEYLIMNAVENMR